MGNILRERHDHYWTNVKDKLQVLTKEESNDLHARLKYFPQESLRCLAQETMTSK
jgi:hypothetical protein